MKFAVAATQLSASGTKAGRLHSGARAFTLVEVLCAAVIAAIIFLALFYGIAQGYNLIATARENLRATQIMTGRIERVRLCSWTQLTNTTLVPTTFTEYFYKVGLGGMASNSVVYNGTMTVGSVPSSFSTASPGYAGAMKQVKVTVNWTANHAGRANSFGRTNITYVSQYGIQNYVYGQ